jgi:hypothetical protein
MAIVSIPADTWTEVVTTTADTAVQNRSGRVMYMTTGDTTSLGLSDGVAVPAGLAIVVGSGVTVSASTIGSDGFAHYMAV